MGPHQKNIFAAFILVIFFAPFLASANGGDQRIIEGRYLINLSRAPFTPRVETQTSFLVSFFDVARNKLISEDLIVAIRIAELGGTERKRTFLFSQEEIAVKGGVLEFPYTFAEAGLHEIFFDFAFASNADKIYEVPDFLIDVQGPGTAPHVSRFIVSAMLGGIFIFALGVLVGLSFALKK